MGMFKCEHGRYDNCGLCHSARNTERMVDASYATRDAVVAAGAAQMAAARTHTARTVDAQFQAAAAQIDANRRLVGAQMEHNERLALQQIAENRRRAAEQRAWEQQQAVHAEEERLLFLDFKDQVVSYGRAHGKPYEDWEVERAWLDLKKREREEQAQRLTDARHRYDAWISSLYAENDQKTAALAEERNALVAARQYTVSHRWLPWAVGLSLWGLISLLNCGIVAALGGVGAGVFAARKFVSAAKANNPALAEDGRDVGLLASTALPVFLVAHGALGLFTMTGVFVALINLALGGWLLSRRDDFQGRAQELAEMDARIGRLAYERSVIGKVTFEMVLEQQGVAA